MSLQSCEDFVEDREWLVHLHSKLYLYLSIPLLSSDIIWNYDFIIPHLRERVRVHRGFSSNRGAFSSKYLHSDSYREQQLVEDDLVLGTLDRLDYLENSMKEIKDGILCFKCRKENPKSTSKHIF